MKYLPALLMCIALCATCAQVSSPDSGQTADWKKLAAGHRQGQPFVVRNKVITGAADLLALGIPVRTGVQTQQVWIDFPVTFEQCTFTEGVLGQKTGDSVKTRIHFLRNFSMLHCHVKSNADLRGMRVDGTCDFTGTIFHGDLHLSGANFKGECWMEECRIAGDFHAAELRCEDEMSLFGTETGGFATFQRAIWARGLQASNTIWNGPVDLTMVRSFLPVYFNYAQFHQRTLFSYGRYDDRLELMQARLGAPTADAYVCSPYMPVVELADSSRPLEFTIKCK